MKISNKIAGASAIALLALSTSAPVFAANVASSTTSTAKMGIKVGTDSTPTDPSDPDDPSHKPDDPDDPDNNGTGNEGPLSIDYVSNLNFGMNDYNGGALTIYPMKLDSNGNATSTPIEKNPWVQITDKRNTGAGWNLSVNYDGDGWVTTDSAKNPLKGAVLTLGTSTFNPKDQDNQSSAPTHDGSTVVSSATNVIGTADKDAGMGTWFERFDKTSTSLMIPAGNTAGQYQANLVWTLTDAAKA